MNTTNGHGGNWGHCEHCQHWQHNQDGHDHLTAGQCRQPELVRFELEVTAQSGCNHFAPAMAENRQAAMAG